MKFPTMDEFAQNVAEKALDEYEYKGKTLREWVEIISAIPVTAIPATDTNVCTKLGTNLAEVGTDCISRQAAIDALRKLREEDIEDYGCEIPEGFNQDHLDRATFAIKQLPPIQPTDNLQKLADEIASFKRRVKSDNSDYLTGYMSALSVVEGMIADMREVTT